MINERDNYLIDNNLLDFFPNSFVSSEYQA